MLRFFKKGKQGYENISPDFFDELRGLEDHIVLDVRTRDELIDGYVSGYQLIDFSHPNFINSIAELDREKTYLVYCRSGNRSSKACEIMNEMGFEKIYNMIGGIQSWNRSKKTS